LEYWRDGKDGLVAELDGRVVGTSSSKPNQLGGGRHGANGGAMTAADASGAHL
jgi:hypothetical protein